ncbi:uncharacterized protein LOC142775915 [Rhipicephalus microplus]|uniref:uncharacterized protein LOC142775915 n=1 Tax=Rhipicephalus microplus TaxID=6941 RepID=UPI003F6D5D1E
MLWWDVGLSRFWTWMYAADERQNSAVTIRQWMGKFEGIANVAKHMARMGQCFSSTEQPVRVKPCDVQKEPDIIAGAHSFSREPYIFSDGIDMMSLQLAEEVSASWGHQSTSVLGLLDSPSSPRAAEPTKSMVTWHGRRAHAR